MKTFVCVIILVIFAVFFALFPFITIAQEISNIGMILDVRSPVFLIQETGDAEIDLDENKDIGRTLYPNQILRCGHEGSLRLQMNGNIIDLIESDGYFMIPTHSESGESSILSEKQRIIGEALRDYSRVGGTRGFNKSSSIFIYPVHGSAVRGSHFVIYWRFPARAGTVSVKIQTESGIELWRQEKIEVSSGRLNSIEAQKRLIEYQAIGGHQGIILYMINPDSNEIRTDFSLLSIQDEKELKRELSLWEGETSDLMRYIGRAYTFNHYRMFYESAQEFDAALTIAPKSYDLLQAAINAHNKIGNFVHEDELKKRLAIINK